MEEGCKNHRETLYSSKEKIVYVVASSQNSKKKLKPNLALIFLSVIYFVVFALRYVPCTNILVVLVCDEAMVAVMSAESDSKYIMIPMYGAAKINDHINHNKITIQVFIGVRLMQPFSSVTFLQGNTPII